MMKSDSNSAKQKVTFQKYWNILQKHLPIVMDADSLIMHNNALIHKAQTIQQWFQHQIFDLIQRVIYLLDFNPTENP